MYPGRLIAIGDIHGCASALARLIEAIRPGLEDTVVPLGDYIDRGPDSRGVIELLMQLEEQCQLVPLLGNHEEMFLVAREGGSPDLQFFLRFGGQETLDSYHVFLPWEIPDSHMRFLKRCQNYYETVDHIFVHAYYVPNTPMANQSAGVLRWTPLPASPEPHCSGKIAVVGHTPQFSGEILDLGYLKCLDTFCHGGGWLTALDVTTGKLWQANRDGVLRG